MVALILLVGIPIALIVLCYFRMGIQCMDLMFIVATVIYLIGASIVAVVGVSNWLAERKIAPLPPKAKSCPTCGKSMTWLETKEDFICFHCSKED